MPMVLFPLFPFISPDDNNPAPISEMETANSTEKDFFSPNSNIMASATANGYMK